MYALQILGRNPDSACRMIVGEDVLGSVEALLAKAGLTQPVLSVAACSKGGNNRAYRVQTTDQVFAAKQYFRHEQDTRDRLTTEFEFLSYAHDLAPGFTPKPYAKDDLSGMALYEFVEGRAFTMGEIGVEELVQAAKFFCALNQPRARTKIRLLPLASEACFSIKDHVDLVGARLQRLNSVVVCDEEDGQLSGFMQKLLGHWQKVVADIQSAARDVNLDITQALDEAQRCVSPSDFGFHNALRRPGGDICFLDFEYAGQDDPAKMAGDFFAQLAVPVPEELFEDFIANCFAPLPFPTALAWRARMLRPVYQVKWCCIALNVFVPTHMARRKFANPDLDVSSAKRVQLAKATHLYQSFGS